MRKNAYALSGKELKKHEVEVNQNSHGEPGKSTGVNRNTLTDRYCLINPYKLFSTCTCIIWY